MVTDGTTLDWQDAATEFCLYHYYDITMLISNKLLYTENVTKNRTDHERCERCNQVANAASKVHDTQRQTPAIFITSNNTQ